MAAKHAKRKRSVVAETTPDYLPRRVLLDTHVWLWWFSGDRRLGKQAISLIRETTEAHVSAASVWEIAIKRGLGKLTVRDNIDIAREIERDGFTPLPITLADANAVYRLPSLHRDPFDRMLVAQAKVNELTILTADDLISRYDVPVLDARM